MDEIKVLLKGLLAKVISEEKPSGKEAMEILRKILTELKNRSGK